MFQNIGWLCQNGIALPRRAMSTISGKFVLKDGQEEIHGRIVYVEVFIGGMPTMVTLRRSSKTH
jgi:hypothetical protein